ncbi:MAG: hypothetical protein A2X64_10815 [Ignavibacteria bacterium GWF2_33_9]|nr:MAG: hypothetical protein A2X64_10815 [Ignavibacteria bacterium GWF2_33_9]
MFEVNMYDIKYITDEKGTKTDIQMKIDEYYSLLEEIEDLRAIAERKDEELIPHNLVKESLEKYE